MGISTRIIDEFKPVIGRGFLSRSGDIVVTDPCYTHAETTIRNCCAGRWLAYCSFAEPVMSDGQSWGKRVAALWILHESVKNPSTLLDPKWTFTKAGVLRIRTPWKDTDTGTGVDSGQAGFWDAKEFEEHRSGGRKVTDSDFYDHVCAHSDEGCYTLDPAGVASSSGMGDGGYPCLEVRDGSGLATALCLDYLEFLPTLWERKALAQFDPKNLPAMLGHVREDNEEFLAELIKKGG